MIRSVDIYISNIKPASDGEGSEILKEGNGKWKAEGRVGGPEVSISSSIAAGDMNHNHTSS